MEVKGMSCPHVNEKVITHFNVSKVLPLVISLVFFLGLIEVNMIDQQN